MKKTTNQTLHSVITLGIALMLASSSVTYAQNFDLVNQKPDQQQTTQDTDQTAQKAYAAAQPLINQDDENTPYTLGPNDVVTVTVQRHPEVSGKYTINMEGKIQYEFVGDVYISGMTKDQATVAIAKRLEKYIINPDVTVVITEYNSKVVYVIGEVGTPGKVFMRGDTITVREALLSANLPELTAATDNATLFTPSASGKVVIKKVNVYALLYKGDLRQNYVMNPGDTLYLPATLWAKVARFINPVTQPMGAAAGTAASVHAI